MTTLLELAFAEAAKRSVAEQELIALWLLAEMESEYDFDRAIAQPTDQLVQWATDALAEHRAGLTNEMDSDRR